jgi:putative ATPase
MKELGYGKEYQYSHLYKDNFSEQEYLPKTLSGTIFYEPGNNKREEEIKNNLRKLWQNKYKY